MQKQAILFEGSKALKLIQPVGSCPGFAILATFITYLYLHSYLLGFITQKWSTYVKWSLLSQRDIFRIWPFCDLCCRLPQILEILASWNLFILVCAFSWRQGEMRWHRFSSSVSKGKAEGPLFLVLQGSKDTPVALHFCRKFQISRC